MIFGSDYYSINFFSEDRCLDNFVVRKYEGYEGWYFLVCPIRVGEEVERHPQRWEVSKKHIEPCDSRSKGVLCPRSNSRIGKEVVHEIKDKGWEIQKIAEDEYLARKPLPTIYT